MQSQSERSLRKQPALLNSRQKRNNSNLMVDPATITLQGNQANLFNKAKQLSNIQQVRHSPNRSLSVMSGGITARQAGSRRVIKVSNSDMKLDQRHFRHAHNFSTTPGIEVRVSRDFET